MTQIITIKDALKFKNKLASELKKLQTLIANNNSVMVGNTPKFNILELVKEYNANMELLISTKKKIHEANAPVYDKIFRLSELKNLVGVYRCIDTKEGKTIQYGAQAPVEYVVTYSESDIRSFIEDLETEIDKIQNELDIHNFSTKIEIEKL